MLRMWSFCISGPVCIRGDRFIMILMSFFCVLISGCRYVLVGSSESDFPDEVWVGVGVVELFHRACGKELCGVPVTLYDWL